MKALSFSKFPKLIVAGHIIECFDNTLYGFFAVMLGPLFFPSFSEQANILASYGAFAAGFLARPLGAIVFGHLGDTRGRRRTLIYSVALVSIPTLIIGILPTYDSIGLASPFILIACRLTQGFLMGGEFTGANLYISENALPTHRGKGTGILISSGIMGAVLATLVGGVVTLESMPQWGWRLPFIGGGLAAFIVYLLRRKMHETEAFSKAQKAQEIISHPWKLLVRNYKKSILIGAFIAGLTIVPLYCATILGNKFLKEWGYTTSECMMFNTFGMVIDAVFVLLCGYMADRVGFYRTMVIGTLSTALVSLVSFYPLLSSHPSLVEILWFIFSLVGIGCVINGCGIPYIADYFPTHCRFSGVALSVTLGHALLGGTTPAIGAFLADTFNSKFAPAYWVSGLSLLTFFLIAFNKKPAEKLSN